MRNAIFSFFIIVLICLSCKKSDNNLLITDGMYKGTFQRFAGDAVWISNVSITFSAGKWTGNSDSAKYPALCNGTYIVNGENNINFKMSAPGLQTLTIPISLMDNFICRLLIAY